MERTSEGSPGDPSVIPSGEEVNSGVPERLENTNPSEASAAAEIKRLMDCVDNLNTQDYVQHKLAALR
ncbi:unnamed protein product [Acanthoscelides obtectus]|uniref:Uncharacterized protein n=1 Tax=Acanthoscelides obtectus TaxID=200917 RepID=A0A9P0PSU8_ACAOB|nr:unnamed protein product [Acanthoscelides obtectus]CAK1667146.1 hypothetical protein AOBTE_LOCUS25699 [Acanthoscelides obtectus]